MRVRIITLAHIGSTEAADKTKTKMNTAKLNWTTDRKADSTHSANDGVVTYYAAAHGMTMQQVATAFLAGYDVSEEHEGEEVEFTVADLATEKELSFAGLPDHEAK